LADLTGVTGATAVDIGLVAVLLMIGAGSY
jgi:hypothetical protein